MNSLTEGRYGKNSSSSSSSSSSGSSSLKSMLKSLSKGLHEHLKMGHSRDGKSDSTSSSSSSSSAVSLSRRFVRVVYNDEPQLVGGLCAGHGYWCPYPLLMDMLGPYLISQDDYIKECKERAESVPNVEGSVLASGH